MNKNLANEIRPQTIKDLVGQNHLKPLLFKVAQNKLTTSFIFFGESGIGKTSAAISLANDLEMEYGYFNASVDSKADLTKILSTKQIIIIDEIHRLNKDKQDILLSYLEFDKIIVYATTTENPYFKVNPALRSRMQILQFKKLSEAELVAGLRNIQIQYFPDLNISDERLIELANYSAGDFRLSINNLQMLAFLSEKSKPITQADLKTIIPNINFYSDSNQSAHYNNLSAFHKSLRGSDPDAALYYGFLILKSGDIDGLFRRLLCAAYEDVGLASSNVALRVQLAIQAFERLGLPEGKLPIANAILDVALAPKSNSAYLAISNVEAVLDQGKIYEVPKHLRDSHYASAQKLGDGIGYIYPHDNIQTHYVKQTYLPKELINSQFYLPSNNTVEQSYVKYWNEIKKRS
ncbi:replication-associated recombination protein A [Mycoplasmopsis gallopavonis]|uniref:ATPase n=2 Tax=Mycoplasmopsis gallopavonis TaxID=76629 RepID=A0A449AZ26_9BACT|nr:replication-associated recombination protein A [Mycoplasmopsis gallopavonis]RIV16928.1 replication-associated recombination protein A [Mycoplasmopsis gallopavonis]VEU72737.1 ATPase [Mycoplasmopsis gallopavonis]